MADQTPSMAMFEFFKKCGMKKNELADIILSDRKMYNGISPRKKAHDNDTWLTRQVVQARPGDFGPSHFADFAEAAQAIASSLYTSKRLKKEKISPLDAVTGEGADGMCEALTANGLDARLYRNYADRLQRATLGSEADRLMLNVMLLVATGCLGDPARAGEAMNAEQHRLSHRSSETVVADDTPDPNDVSAKERKSCLSLTPMESGGALHSRSYKLSTDPEGTEIGALSEEINDVAPTVSRLHLRIFRAKDGCWYAIGMKSKNGTYVIRGIDDNREDIELPRGDRPRNWEPMPVQIFPGDVLVLGKMTHFLVSEVIDE